MIEFGRTPLDYLFASSLAAAPAVVEPEEDTAREESAESAEPARRPREIVLRILGREPHVIEREAQAAAPIDAERAEWNPTVSVDTPPAYDFLYDPAIGCVRFRVAWGGRGAGRSWQFARALLIHGMARRLRILCAREWQNSIKDSVHRVLSDQIARLGLRDVYTVRESSITGENGTEFIFKGLRRDIGAIKSTEGIDVAWVEEGQSVSDHSWRELTPTIRADGSEIWVTFNTGDEQDATYRRMVAPTIPEHALYDPQFSAIVRKTSYRDNPWLPRVLKGDEQASLRTDPEEHAHVWEGEFWRRSKAQVLNGKWRSTDFTPTKEWGHPYYGVDWGFANDPLVIVRVWVYDSRLWVEYAEGGTGIDEHDDIARLFDTVPGSRDYMLRADSARPETISAMRRRKFNIVAARKWDGSVKDGIAHLRSYEEIVIHPRATRAIQEARLWRYKTRSGVSGDPNAADAEVLPELVKGNEHTWDGSRYALDPLIRRRESDEPPPSVSQAIG